MKGTLRERSKGSESGSINCFVCFGAIIFVPSCDSSLFPIFGLAVSLSPSDLLLYKHERWKLGHPQKWSLRVMEKIIETCPGGNEVVPECKKGQIGVLFMEDKIRFFTGSKDKKNRA